MGNPDLPPLGPGPCSAALEAGTRGGHSWFWQERREHAPQRLLKQPTQRASRLGRASDGSKGNICWGKKGAHGSALSLITPT